jgi:hypothetical protein
MSDLLMLLGMIIGAIILGIAVGYDLRRDGMR